jgi:glycerophosphoryl diester phosphodiesterase
MGALDGKSTLTNSLEAIIQNYDAGHRIFEIDFQLTSDNILIALHNRDTPIKTYQQEKDLVTYTLLNFEDICNLMLEYKDIYIITDTKSIDSESNRMIFNIIRDTVNKVDPDLTDRIAMQFYNQEMYSFLTENYLFPHKNYIYTLYRSFDTKPQVVNFIKQESIRTVVMWDQKVNDKDFVAAIRNEGAFVFAHTYNDAAEANALFSNGVYGVYTDTLTYDDLPHSRMGRYVMFTQNLSSWAEPQVNRAIKNGLVPKALQSNYTKAITRAEFCALCVALYEKATDSLISAYTLYDDTIDVNVQKLGGLGVVGGTGGGNFSPDEVLTREQAAVILSRLAEALGKPLRKYSPTFSDNTRISFWAWSQVGQIQAAGLISGVGNNRFAPRELCNREQSIIMITRLFDSITDIKTQ